MKMRRQADPITRSTETAAKGDWGRAHLLDLIRNLAADVADNLVAIANVFLAARRRTPIWCPQCEIFDLAFSPETERGP